LIYLDSSVVLAFLLAEDRKPVVSLWAQPVTSSRLIEYEIWTTVNGKGLTRSHGEATRDLLERVSLLELSPLVLARALEPFPLPVRTLDAIHLSSIEYLRSRRIELTLATFDRRMAAAAEALGVRLATIE
jgi:predicted nucleic acid-binding protein